MVTILKGATSQAVYLEVLDSASTTGGRKTGIAFNAAGLTAYYARNKGAATAITLATQTATGAYSSGGWVEVDATNMPGVYRLDIPDAALASGVDSVVVTAKGASGMVQVSKEIQLTSVNLQDAVRAGLTALPNANAEAAGGLLTRGSGAGQVNQNANGQIDTRTVAMATDVITAAAIQADAIGAAEIANGAIDAATFAAGAIDASAIATDALGALELAAGAATEIAAAVWDEARASHTTAGTFGQGVASVQGNVTGSVASVTGAVGSVTGAVGSVTGAVGSVTGNVGGNVTGSVGSVAAGGITASSIAPDAIGASELAADAVAEIAAAVGGGSAPTAAQNATAVRTELATELARVDVAISTRAAGGAGLPGSGSRSHPILVTQPNGVTPIEGVSVWVTTDAAGTNVVAGTLETDTLGRINTTTGFMLDPGSYYLWRQHGDWNFTNPTAFTVV